MQQKKSILPRDRLATTHATVFIPPTTRPRVLKFMFRCSEERGVCIRLCV